MSALDTATRRHLLERMVLIRTFEEQMQRLFAENRLAGFLHLSIGQEAVAAGVCTALDKTDYIATTHRGHGHILAKGGDPRPMVAELFARESGSCRGVGGSMHLTDPHVGVLCANAIVGASIGLATGAAFSAQYLRSGAVAVAFFGDGAANQGLFHEALNLASIWALPVVYVCENNLYAEMSTQASQSLVTDIAIRAGSYGIPGEVVDGNDVEAVFLSAHRAVERARAGLGPTLLECKTYRTRGHYEGDQQKYKPREEVEIWEERDPIKLYTERLDWADEVTAIRREAAARVDDAIEFALGSAPVEDADLEWLTYSGSSVSTGEARS